MLEALEYNGMWIEVFKTGIWTDSNGNTRAWTEEDLDKIASSYDPREHEAPIVIGHPKDNAPAYGWVEALKREGEKLLAKIKPTAKEFVEWVRKGLYKKVSISLYPDMRLRHVGFLGAVPPAVKGLSPVGFGDGEGAFLIETPAGVSKFIDDEGEGVMDEIKEHVAASSAEKDFLERIEELEAKLREKEDEAKEAEEARRRAVSELMRARQREKRLEFREFLVSHAAMGRLTPAQEKIVLKIAQALAGAQFEEGNQGAEELLKALVCSLPRQVAFGEFATRKKAGRVEDTAEVRERLIAEYLASNKGATFREAVLAVSAKHPELFKEV